MRLLISVSAFALMLGAAQAADVAPLPAPFEPVAPVAPVAFDWSGVYAGGTIGYGWQTSEQTPPLPFPSYEIDAEGLLGGVEAGFNLQRNAFVFGVEGDYSWSGITGSFVPDPNAGSPTTATVDIDWIATVRARAGVAFDRTLLYGTGGIAFAHATGNVTNFIGGGDDRTADATHFGWTLGGGGEFALGGNFTFKAEYLYLNFGSETYDFASSTYSPSPISVDASGTAHVARIGLNYLFH